MCIRRKLIALVSVLSILLLVGFSINQNPQWKGKIEEEDGVKVIKNPEEPLYGRITLEVKEDLRIGNDEDENCIFYKLVHPEVDSLGNILVLDTGNHRVQRFDKDGNFIASFGRYGQGPGEFNYPFRMQLDKQNNIYVIGGRKVHFHNSEGKFQRMIHATKFFADFVIIPEKHLIAHTIMTEYEDEDDKGQMMNYVEIINLDGKLLKPIARYPHKAPNPAQVMVGQSVIGEFLSPQFCFCPMKNGNSIYGYPSEYKIHVLDSSGDCNLIIRKEASPVRITSQEKKETIKSFKTRVEKIRKDSKIKASFPKYKPYYDQLLCDENYNIYVRKATKYKKGEGKLLFDMFNPEGFYLYEIEFSNYPSELLKIRSYDVFDIRNGYLYSRLLEPETDYVRILRFRIKNWDQIKEGI